MTMINHLMKINRQFHQMVPVEVHYIKWRNPRKRGKEQKEERNKKRKSRKKNEWQ